jgi:hypothetical protein
MPEHAHDRRTFLRLAAAGAAGAALGAGAPRPLAAAAGDAAPPRRRCGWASRATRCGSSRSRGPSR